MKKKTIADYIEKLEKHDDLFKKWGELFRKEEQIIQSLIKARKHLGLSQQMLADLTNLKQSAVARIESGAHSPQLNTLVKIADALSLNIDLQPADCPKPHKQTLYTFNIFNTAHDEISNKKDNFYTLNEGGLTDEDFPIKYTCNQTFPA